jgi:DNA (cytosine-5)-methyltransferase 1
MEQLNELALFAGAGGGILGGKLLGWRTVCAVEWEPYPASVLCARQNDRFLAPFPIWDDVQTFDGKPWRGIVDVVSGGFPCQDISAAGKGAGIDGERSGTWREMARIICEVRPRFAFVENSPMLTSRGLGTVLGDLASMGFNARWGVLGAADVGANHQRDRIWIVGKISYSKKFFSNGSNNYAGISMEQETQSELRNNCGSKNVAYTRCKLRDKRDGIGMESKTEIRSKSTIFIEPSNQNVAHTTSIGQQGQRKHEQSIHSAQGNDWETNHVKSIGTSDFWKIEPNVGRVADGVAASVDRLKAIGNGQVPLCAATAWRILSAPRSQD